MSAIEDHTVPISMSTQVGAILRPSPDVIAQRVGNEVILVNLQTNRMYDLNRTGARLWDLLSAGHDQAAIQVQLLREFQVDPVQLAREIGEIVTSLKEAGLVQLTQVEPG